MPFETGLVGLSLPLVAVLRLFPVHPPSDCFESGDFKPLLTEGQDYIIAFCPSQAFVTLIRARLPRPEQDVAHKPRGLWGAYPSAFNVPVGAAAVRAFTASNMDPDKTRHL